MSKVVQAINAMISNPEKITSVFQNKDEYFFLYLDKHKWSIVRSDGNVISLWFYPGEESIKELAKNDGNWANINKIVYRDIDIGTREAKASFLELYTVVKERAFGINDVFEEIIKDDDSTPF